MIVISGASGLADAELVLQGGSKSALNSFMWAQAGPMLVEDD